MNSKNKKIFFNQEILKNLFSDINSNKQLDIEIIDEKEETLKAPEMFNIWIESRKKLSDDEKLDLIKNLQESYFCLNDDISQLLYELENFNKFRIAVLPKIYASNFIKDLKISLKNQQNIIININEYSC